MSLLCVSVQSQARERPVDFELVLAVDVSGSMDADEKLLQRKGYIEAFRHPEVIQAISPRRCLASEFVGGRDAFKETAASAP